MVDGTREAVAYRSWKLSAAPSVFVGATVVAATVAYAMRGLGFNGVLLALLTQYFLMWLLMRITEPLRKSSRFTTVRRSLIGLVLTSSDRAAKARFAVSGSLLVLFVATTESFMRLSGLPPSLLASMPGWLPMLLLFSGVLLIGLNNSPTSLTLTITSARTTNYRFEVKRTGSLIFATSIIVYFMVTGVGPVAQSLLTHLPALPELLLVAVFASGLGLALDL